MAYAWKRLVAGITIEPMLFIFYLFSAIAAYAAGNLLIQKACHPDLNSEPDFSVPCPDEVAAQKIISDIGIWRPFLEYPLPVVVIIFLGAWSDNHGRKRKPLFFVPIIGEIVTNSFFLISIYYWNMSVQVTAAISAVLHGLAGGVICFSFAAFTYISDVTSVEERTMRMGVVAAVVFVSTPIGSVLGGVLRLKIGFFYLFLLSVAFNIVSLILGALLIKNTATEPSNLKTFQGICDASQFITSLKTVVKKRSSGKRATLLLMVLLSPTFLAVYIGEPTYLFFRNKFNFDEVEFGYYSAYRSFTLFLGNIVSVYICTRLFRMSDASIGCLATTTQSVYSLVMCFLAQQRWQLYVYPFLDLMQGTVYTAVRAIVSKTVDGSEVAQVLSVLGAADSLAPLLVYPLYSLVYKNTLVAMPGAFFLLSLVLALIMFILFFSVLMIQKRNKKVDDG